MENNTPYILVVNAGSSSVKFALFDAADFSKKIVAGSIDAASSVSLVMKQLGEHLGARGLAAIGHRVVHGGPNYYVSTLIDEKMLAALRDLEVFDPEHLPEEIRLIEEFHALFPNVPQVACFDTAFHHDLPRVAQIVPIPRKYEAEGVRRYGFHGLSYTFLMKELARTHGEAAARGRVVLAHFGSGVSLAAVRDGRPIDTSMAFTPASGVPMSTRSGDLDPGLAWYLARKDGMDGKSFNEMITNASGLLGISETSGDMKTLLEHEAADPRAAEAVALFCYQVKKYIGAYAAALGGVDTLVFTGGMGEEAPKIRARVCEGLAFLGIEIDENKNNMNAAVISKEGATATVLVVHTDEEVVIAEEVIRLINIKD
jgi:acetate kinase